MSIRTIIAEDEEVARHAIAVMAKSCGLDVVAECADGSEALQSLQKHTPDLLLLDVQMPGKDGFAVLQAAPQAIVPAVIFTTAYDHYAVRAFEHNAVDYLLKPFNEERLHKAVEKVKAQLTNHRNQGELISRLLADLRQAQHSRVAQQKLVIRSKGQVEFLRVDDIDWIESEHNHLRIHVGTEVHMVRQTLGEIETRLPSDKFLRIHRCLIVNVDRIRRLESCGYGEYLVVLKNGRNLSLSRGYRERLDRFLDKITGSTEVLT